MKTTDANYAAYHEEMLKVWGSDTHMIDYCEKKTIKVVKLNDGRIVEQGTHAELAAKPGLYRTICDIQQGKEAEA